MQRESLSLSLLHLTQSRSLFLSALEHTGWRTGWVSCVILTHMDLQQCPSVEQWPRWMRRAYLSLSLPRTSTQWYNSLLNHWYIKPYPVPRAHYYPMTWSSILLCVSFSLSHTHTHKQPIQYLINTKKPLRKRKTEISDTYDSQTSTHLSPLEWSLLQNLGNFEYILRCQ